MTEETTTTTTTETKPAEMPKDADVSAEPANDTVEETETPEEKPA